MLYYIYNTLENRRRKMSKQTELEKLFDEVVEFQQNQDDPLIKEIMQEHKKNCLVLWPDDTLRKCKEAMRYVESQ